MKLIVNFYCKLINNTQLQNYQTIKKLKMFKNEEDLVHETPTKLPSKFSHFTADSSHPSSKKSSSCQNQNQSIHNSNFNDQWDFSMVSPINPYLESFDSRLSPDNEKFSITDRFIPSRKQLQKECLNYDWDQNEENQNNCAQPADSSVFQVSEMYRKYVMSNNRSPENNLDVYSNNNILKYSSKVEASMSQPPIFAKNSSFQFTETLLGSSNNRRKINKLPCKVLDAPALQDDYYLNLIDWSTQNLLAVGLSSSVYLWNAQNSKVSKLCDLGMSDTVTSVSWSLKGPLISLGTNSGQVQIWDVNKMKRTRIFQGHTNRVGAMSWSSTVLSTGSRDKTILQRDIRSSHSFISKLQGHKQQICGLKWSFDEQQLCSGGNDNKLLVWNSHSTDPVLKFNDHVAAVKAMAWSPHQHGLLISGGGTADRTIRFRNTLTGCTTNIVDVGSQVCNLMFSKTLNELVSTHGYSQNEINIWQYPKMKKISTLTGHTFRVLYLAMSPDGQTIVTGAGDETLRFWNVFPNRNEHSKREISELQFQNTRIR